MNENLLQEQVTKARQLPEDIRWTYLNQLPANHFAFTILYALIFDWEEIKDLTDEEFLCIYVEIFGTESKFNTI